MIFLYVGRLYYIPENITPEQQKQPTPRHTLIKLLDSKKTIPLSFQAKTTHDFKKGENLHCHQTLKAVLYARKNM